MGKTAKEILEEMRNGNKTNTKTNNTSNGGSGKSAKSILAEMKLSTLSNKINSYSKSANALYNEHNSRYYDTDGKPLAVTYRSDYSDWRDKVRNQSHSLETQAKEINDILFEYGDYYDDEYISKIKDVIKPESFNSIREQANSDYDYYSQWADEDSYNRAMAYAKEQEDKKSKYSSMSDDELDAEIERLKESKKGNVLSNFAMRVVGAQDSNMNLYAEAESNQEYNDSVNNDISLIEKEKTNRKYKQIDKLPEDVRSLIDELTVIDSGNDDDEFVNDANVLISGLTGGNNVNYNADSDYKRFGEIVQALESKGIENWHELLEYNKLRYNEKKNAPIKEADAEMAKEHPVLSSLVSIPASLGKGIGVVEMLENVGSDTPLDPNSPYFSMNNFVNTTRETVMDEHDLHLNTGNKTLDNIDLFDELYGTAMSMGDSVAAGVGLGGVGGVALGLSAATDSAQEVAENGGSSTEAIVTGLVSGLNEMLWESLSLGRLNDLISNGVSKRGFKAFVGELFKSMGINASEEFNTEASNLLADYLINGGASTYSETVQNYLSMGYADNEAKAQAKKDMLVQMSKAGVGGALQGLFMGIGGGAFSSSLNAIESKAYENKYYNNIGQSIIDQGNLSQLVEETEALGNERTLKSLKDLANQVSGVKTEELDAKGSKKYAHQVGKLYKGVQEAQLKNLSKSSETAFKNVIKAELEKTGVDNVDKTVDILVKAAHNEGLTRAESKLLQSVNGHEILNKAYSSAEFVESLNAEEKKQFEESRDNILDTVDLTRNKGKAKILSESEYDISSDDKTTIEATGDEVEIVSIDSLDGDDISLSVKSGDSKQVVLAGELRLNEDYVVILEGLKDIKADFGLDVASANSILALWDGYNGDVVDFSKAMKSGIMYGQYNMRKDFENSRMGRNVPDNIRNRMFEIGREYKQRATTEQDAHRKATADANASSIGDFSITFADDVKYKKLNKKQKAQIDMAQIIAQALGFNLEVFRSPKDALGHSMGEMGSYTVTGTKDGKYKTNTMKLDIDAATLDGKSLILFTQAHELTHFIKAWSLEKYQVFADFLIEKYGEKDVPLENLIQSKINESKLEGNAILTYDEAFEEVVCNACENFLADPKIQQTILDIAQEDITIAQKIKNFIKNLINRLDKALRGLESDSAEAKYVSSLDIDDIKKLKEMWLEALKDAKANVEVARERAVEEQNVLPAKESEAQNNPTDEDDTKFKLRSTVEETKDLVAVHGNDNSRTEVLNSIEDVKFKMRVTPEQDADYLELAKNPEKNEARLREMVDEVARANGYTIRAYHGTARGDRVGNVFLPERATSGPMAFFTDNKEIAENYSKSKQDTSIAYDPDFDRYETQFRIKTKYQDIPLYRAWGYLPFDARNRITKKAGQLREDWDEDYDLILDPETNEANGGFQWQLKEARGNTLLALNEQWLNSGTLFNNESRFLDVLEMTGVIEEFKKIGMDTLYFKDPKAKHEKVYDTFLKITKPFDTSTVNEQFIDGLLSWYENQDEAKYVRESSYSDLWDKNSIDAYEFADRLKSDIKNGTFHAWTSIPDSVTAYLKELGYDGIKDLGGKGGGVGHTVWIPFSSEQIKSSEPVTYDDNGNIIPLSERFNEDNNDIRYKKRGYWKPDMPKADLDQIKMMAKSELPKTDKYIDSITKWLYNTKNGKNYFAIYSTEDENEPTILYASLDDEAVDDFYFVEYYMNFVKEMEGDINVRRAETIDEIFSFYKRSDALYIADSGYDVERQNTSQAVQVHPRTSKRRLHRALRNCLQDCFRRWNSERLFDGVKHKNRPYQPSLEDLGIDYKEENEHLKADADRLKEMLKLQGTVTHGKVLAKASYEGVAKKLLHEFGMKRVTDTELLKEFINRLDSFYSYIINEDDLIWEDMFNKSMELARWLDSKLPEQVVYKNANAVEILRDIREKGIMLSDKQKEEATYYAGSLAAYRKMNFGNFKIVNEGGIALTDLWEQLITDYPGAISQEYIEKGEVAENLPSLIVEVVEAMRQTENVINDENRMSHLREMATAIYDSYWNVPTVKTLADKHQQKVNLLKSQHKAEMDVLREKRDSKLKDTKAYYQDMVKRIRADKDAKMDAYKERVQEQKKKNVEGRNKTATKNKIKKVIKTLESLYSNPTKEKNVKIEFQDMVRDALVLANVLFDDGNISSSDILSGNLTIRLGENEKKKVDEWRAVYESRQKYRDKLDALESSGKVNQKIHDELLDMINRCNNKLNRLGRDLSDVVERQKAELNEESLKNAIGSLVKAYKSLKDSPEGYAQAAYNDFVAKRLETLEESLAKATVKSMTLTQLDELYQAYKMVLTTVRTANDIFVKNKRMSVVDMGEAVISEVKKVANPTDSKVAALKGIREFSWEELKTVYAFERIGSETFMQLYKEVLRGQGVVAQDIAEAQAFFDKMNKTYGYDSWDLKETKDFKLADGRIFTINLQEIMSIYAYSKREQALDHITNGGFVFDNKEFFTDTKEKGLKGKIKKQRTTVKAYRINDEMFYKIINSLTKEQKKFAEEMQDYLTSMGEKGNEVSRVLYGIDIFNEKHYFPLMSSKAFIQQTNEPVGTVTLKNSGMTKATVPHARNPIVLQGFMDVWANHINKMSTYHGLVLPIENLNKVFNYTGYAHEDESVSVETILSGAYGDEVNKYIENFITDLNGGIKTQSSGNWVTKGISLFKKTAVAASTSVVVQQPTAIVRAMAMINPKYFVHGKDGIKHKEAWEKIKKYAPIAIVKEMGGFDVGSGRQVADYITAKEYKGRDKVKGFFTDSTYRDDALMWGATKADEFGWITIWNAVEKEIADTTTYKVGSEEFLQACGERFTEVIDYTQVYDSVLSRSGFMRNKGEISKMATSFMGEPTTSFNMLYNAILQAKRGNIGKGEMTKIMGATVSSIILASIAKSLIYALRDDDEDESYAEKYAQSLTNSLMEDLFIPNMLPYVSDITSLLSGWDVERTDMAILKDFKDAIDDLDSSNKSLWRKVEDLGGAVAAFGGIPAKNVMRTVREIYNLVANVLDDNTASASDVGDAIVETVVGETSSSDINEALEKGNTAKAKKIINDLVADKVKQGKTQKEAKAFIKASVTSYWKELYLQAYRDKDNAEMLRIRQILQSTGLYDNVVETCSNWIKSMKDETTNTTYKKW